MFMSNENNNCAVFCNCGCNNGVILKAMDDDNEIEISLVSDTFHSDHTSVWQRFKEKCKRIWKIICNKEYQYFSIYLSTDDLNDFGYFILNKAINKDEDKKEN